MRKKAKVNSLIATSNVFLNKHRDEISKSVAVAEKYAFPKLGIDWNIDVVIASGGPVSAIPEDGVGGHTYNSNLIVLEIKDGSGLPFVSEVLCHELCHAARWGKNDEWMHNLFDCIIFEGLATYFEATFAEEQSFRQFFIRSITERSDEVNLGILTKLQGLFDSDKYNRKTIFFDGDEHLPRWSGYSLGYFLVRKYLENNGRKIEDVFAERYSSFRNLAKYLK